METQKENKLPGVFTLLNDALTLYGARYRTPLGIMLLPVVLSFLLTILALNPLLTVIITILVSSWAFLSILISFKEGGGGIIENYRLALPKLLSYIYINFLIAIATIPGIFLFGFTAVIYFIWFSFATYVMVTENYFGPNALMRSREYVVHRWWQVTGRVLFIVAIILAFQLLGFLLVQLISLTGLLKTGGAVTLARATTTNIFSLFTIPLNIAYSYTLFQNLRATRPELAKQPVNGRYKWLYIFSPTTILVILLALIGIVIGLLAKI
jgi:hypothetical protein